MPVIMKVTVDQRDVNDLLKRLEPRDVGRALSQSINDSLRQTAKFGAGVGAAAAGVPVSSARARFFVDRASPSHPEGAVRVKHKPLNLINFMPGAKPPKAKPKKGVRAKAWGKPKLYRGTFTAPASIGGRVIVWHRTGAKRIASKGRYAGKLREIIEPIWGPSIYQVLKESRVIEVIEAHGSSRMQANLLRQVDRILRQRELGIKSRRGRQKGE